MTAGFSGADVQQLEALAKRFEAQAAKCREVVAASTSLLFVAEWTGGKVDRLRHDWNQSARPVLLVLAEDLQRSAGLLRRQAEEQRTASGVRSSGGGSRQLDDIRQALSSQPDLSPADIEEIIGRLRQALGDTLTGVDMAGTVLDIVAGLDLPTLSKILPGIGLALGAADFVDRTADGDYFGAFMTFLSSSVSGAQWVGSMGLVGGSAGAAAASLGPLALGIGALTTFIDWTLPTTGEKQDATLQKGAEHLFGEGVDVDNLTMEQAEGVRKRYEGPAGVLYMISDTMDATADRIFPWNW